jgi:hypothetical protein
MTVDPKSTTLGIATPFSWEAKPQPVNHSDPRHIETVG